MSLDMRHMYLVYYWEGENKCPFDQGIQQH